jgi:hypothetical protein
MSRIKLIQERTKVQLCALMLDSSHIALGQNNLIQTYMKDTDNEILPCLLFQVLMGLCLLLQSL